MHSSVSNLNRKSWERIGGLSCASWLYADPSPLGCLDWETEFKLGKTGPEHFDVKMHSSYAKCIWPGRAGLIYMVRCTAVSKNWFIIVPCGYVYKNRYYGLSTVWRALTHRERVMLKDAFGDKCLFFTNCMILRLWYSRTSAQVNSNTQTETPQFRCGNDTLLKTHLRL